MKKFYLIAVKEILNFMQKCDCSQCKETTKVLLEKNPEVNQ
jgi:hypothetical protein